MCPHSTDHKEQWIQYDQDMSAMVSALSQVIATNSAATASAAAAAAAAASSSPALSESSQDQGTTSTTTTTTTTTTSSVLASRFIPIKWPNFSITTCSSFSSLPFCRSV